jgi:sugar lactone lactonase YvrE
MEETMEYIKKIPRWIMITFILSLVISSMAFTKEAITKDPGVTVRILAKGAPIHGTNGVMFDSKDRLYIASVFGNEIIVMDPRSGTILQRLGPNEPLVETPDDLTFGPKGTPYEGYLYWTSILSGWVNRLSPDGILKRQFVAAGVNPITFTDDGRLFVALDFYGDGLYELDPDLEDAPRPIIVPTPENPFPLGFLNGMDIGPDGYLYGPLWIPGMVVRINVDTGALQVITSGLANPAAVKFNSKGELYVAEQTSGEISRIDIKTGAKHVVATGLQGLDNIAFDSRDRLYVSHAHDGSINEVLPNGRTRAVSKGGMIAPGGIAVKANPDGGESVFVADYWTLREINGVTGKQESVERHKIAVPGTMITPATVAVDGDNFVISSFDSVQVWAPATREPLEYYNDFGIPMNAVRFQGDLVVADAGGMQVVRQTPSGRITLANYTNGIYVPMGFAATEDDLWVSDWATGCVWRLYDDGELLPSPRLVAWGLSNPEGLALDNNGNLLVVESGASRLSRINPAIGAIEVVAEGLELGYFFLPSYPMIFFNGVAVGPSGAIYVTGDRANVLYRIEIHK